MNVILDAALAVVAYEAEITPVIAAPLPVNADALIEKLPIAIIFPLTYSDPVI